MKEFFGWSWLVLCLMALVAGVVVLVLIVRALWKLGPVLIAVVAGIEAANRREARAEAREAKADLTLAKVETAAVDAKAAIETAATVAATVAVGTKDEIKQTIVDEFHAHKASESHFL